MKIDRKSVYAKYDGHCAYCGKEITIKEMEVDHLHPKRIGGTDDMDNLMPSCHTCNHYKRANSLEHFRDWLLGGLIDRLMKVYIFRVALRYNMITINGWDKKFYFEKNTEMSKNEGKKTLCKDCTRFKACGGLGKFDGVCEKHDKFVKCNDYCINRRRDNSRTWNWI